MIDVSGLHVVLGHGSGRVHALRGVSFHVDEGATLGLVGESGSGKTTVLRAICGLDMPARGRIAIGGKPLPARQDRAFCKQVQMVFQDPYGSLHPRHTVDRILAEPLAIQGIDGVDRRIAAILHEVGLEPRYRFRFPHQLSGGQRQRVAIARALILEPGIMLLDEPTSALDVSVQAEILNLLADIRTHRRLTCILVSHDLSVVSHMCDRLAVMKQGCIVEHLAVEALRRGEPQHPYTRQLLAASLGYDRTAVDGFREDTPSEDTWPIEHHRCGTAVQTLAEESMFLANEIFDMAVQFEKNGESVYRSAVSRVSDPALANLLEWMADEEARHAELFSRLKKKKAGGGSRPFSQELSRELLDEMIGDQSFSLGDVDFKAIEHQNELIRTFIEFEKDTIIFYEMLTPFIEDAETRVSLETIIDEENNHIERLKVFLENEETRPAFTDC